MTTSLIVKLCSDCLVTIRHHNSHEAERLERLAGGPCPAATRLRNESARIDKELAHRFAPGGLNTVK